MADPEAFVAGPAEARVREALTALLGRAVRGEAEPTPARPVRREPSSAAAAGRPIHFNAAMVRALLAGNKTQTRRPIRPLPAGEVPHRVPSWPADAGGSPLRCGLAEAGGRLWVREPWAYATDAGPVPTRGKAAKYVYEADVGPAAARAVRWKPGRFLARDASRLALVVTQIAPQRLQAIGPHDAAAEGMPPGLFSDEPGAAVLWFRRLWDSIYAGGEFAWEADPWVWVVRFRVDAGRGKARAKAHG